MRKFRFFTILVLFTFLINSGFGCKWNPFQQNNELYKPVTLEYWGVWDTEDQLKNLISSYEKTHPTVKINYRRFRYDEYERELLEAWADDRGPDIFAIPANWIKDYQKRIVPMPASHQIPVYEVQGTIKQETVTVMRKFAGLTPQDIKNRYVPAVYNNIVVDNKVWGLPYSLDTLVTFYNLDMITQAGIAEPIKDFFDLVDQTPKLTKATEGNKIIQSAVALGGTSNIPRFFDIFSSIMLQNGVTGITDTSFRPLNNEDSTQRLIQAFNFYTDFARPGKSSYSWNKDLDDAFEMFASGKLAYFFGYSYHADELRRRKLQFDWGITNFPQTRGAQGTKYYANFWVNVVAKKSKNQDAAWNFIQSTAAESLVKDYLKENKKPTALRSLIDSQLADYDTSVFASQVLTADTWYHGYDANLAEQYLGDFIDKLVSGEYVFDEENSALRLLVNQINQTYREPQ